MSEKKPVGRKRRVLQVVVALVGLWLINVIFNPLGMLAPPAPEPQEKQPYVPQQHVEVPPPLDVGKHYGIDEEREAEETLLHVEDEEEVEETPPVIPRVPTIVQLRESGWDASLIPEYESSNEMRTEYVRLLRELCTLYKAEEQDEEAKRSAENELVARLFRFTRPDPESTWGWRKRGVMRRIGFAGGDKAKLEMTFEVLLYDCVYTDAKNQNRRKCTSRAEIESLAKAFGWEGEREYRLFLQELFLTDKHFSRTGGAIMDDTGFWAQ